MSLLTVLKSETAERHAALENGLDLFKRSATAEGYLGLVQGFYTLCRPLERHLAESMDWTQVGWDFEARLKTGWLEQDLRALGMSPAQIQNLPLCAHVPPVENLGQAIGCLYVLEGSTLGGQFISRRLRESLGVTPETGGQFFFGYGPDTGAQWKRFGTWAEALAAADPTLQPVAVGTAKATFDCFHRWFDCQ